jgi:O-antigen/teichoic acid export membrane protein
MSFRSSILRDTALNFGALAFTVVGGLASSILIARYLGPTLAGGYSYVGWTVAVIATIAEGGMTFAIVKFVAQLRGAQKEGEAVGLAAELLKRQIWVGIVAALILIGVSFGVRAYPFPRLLLLGALTVFPWVVGQVFTAALSGSGRFDLSSLLTSAGALAQVALVLIVIAMRGGAGGMLLTVTGKLSVPLIFGWIAWRAVSKSSSSQDQVSDESVKSAKRFAWSTMAITICYMVLWQRSEIFLVERYCAIAAVAFYSISYSIVELLAEGAATFSRVLMQRSSAAFGGTGTRGAAAYFGDGVKYMQMVSVPICGLIVVTAPTLVQKIYGPAYAPMTIVLRILVGSAALSVLSRVAMSIMMSADHEGTLLRQSLFFVAADLLICWWAIARWGVVGGASGKATVQIVATVAALGTCMYRLGGAFPLGATVKIYVCTGLAAVPAVLVSKFHGTSTELLFAVCAGALIYACALVALRLVTERDIRGIIDSFSSTSNVDAPPGYAPLP